MRFLIILLAFSIAVGLFKIYTSIELKRVIEYKEGINLIGAVPCDGGYYAVFDKPIPKNNKEDCRRWFIDYLKVEYDTTNFKGLYTLISHPKCARKNVQNTISKKEINDEITVMTNYKNITISANTKDIETHLVSSIATVSTFAVASAFVMFFLFPLFISGSIVTPELVSEMLLDYTRYHSPQIIDNLVPIEGSRIENTELVHYFFERSGSPASSESNLRRSAIESNLKNVRIYVEYLIQNKDMSVFNEKISNIKQSNLKYSEGFEYYNLYNSSIFVVFSNTIPFYVFNIGLRTGSQIRKRNNSCIFPYEHVYELRILKDRTYIFDTKYVFFVHLFYAKIIKFTRQNQTKNENEETYFTFESIPTYDIVGAAEVFPGKGFVNFIQNMKYRVINEFDI